MGDRIIFLDVDNVLNTDRTEWVYNGYVMFDRGRILRVKKIVEETGAKIVLSSTWRMGWINDPKGWYDATTVLMFEELRQAFRDEGMDFYDKTPFLHSMRRGDEITTWLRAHDVDNYVIVDDQTDDMQEHASHIVKISPRRGLDEYAQMKIINKLKLEKSE